LIAHDALIVPEVVAESWLFLLRPASEDRFLPPEVEIGRRSE
jgi:hypothetical protein